LKKSEKMNWAKTGIQKATGWGHPKTGTSRTVAGFLRKVECKQKKETNKFGKVKLGRRVHKQDTTFTRGNKRGGKKINKI